MNRCRSFAFSATGFLLAVGQAQAGSITTTTLSVDFESPTFAVGAIGGNPGLTAGQGGWGGYSPGAISAAQAYSGTQSLQTVLAGYLGYGGATKVLDATNGEYPIDASVFNIGPSFDWWVQARVYVASGGVGARMTLANGLGGCPYLQISGTGTPSVEPCTAGVPPVDLANQGANVLDQWVLMQMVHTTSMLGEFEISFIGPNVNVSATMGYAGPPGTSTEQYIILGGDAFWDDVSAGYGPVPAPVPLPAAAWLLIPALGALAGRVRRRRA